MAARLYGFVCAAGLASVGRAATLRRPTQRERLSRPYTEAETAETMSRRGPVISYCTAKKHRERVIEPELPIIDPHHHFFDPPEPYYLPELLGDLASGHNITKTVFVECGLSADPLEEVTRVEAFRQEAERTGHPGVTAGIVGTVNLSSGLAVEEVLRAQMAASPNFRGVRQWPAEMVNFSSPQVRAAISVLDKLGLLLETTGAELRPLRISQILGSVADLARAFPMLTVVLDHSGGTLGPKEFNNGTDLAIWKETLRELASNANVRIKVGGLHMERNGFSLQGRGGSCKSSRQIADMMYPHYKYVIETFGPGRCMFESNFPMDKWGADYRTLWNSFKRVAARMGLSADDKAALFRGTAAAVYKI